MTLRKILITEACDPALIEGLQHLGFQVDYQPGILMSDLINNIHKYTGLVVATRILVDRKILDHATELKFIARAGSGMENIDVEYAQSKNIACINSPEGNANSVGEHATGLLLAMFHNITKSYSETLQLKWQVEENRVHELEGTTIGLIGYGNTGKSFAKKLSVFGMNVLAYDKYLKNYSDRFASEASMNEIFFNAHIVSFHIPLTGETKELVTLEYINRFQQEIYLINTSRGKIIRHRDLLNAIKRGRVTSAALDVYENEKFEIQTVEERNTFASLVETGKVIFTPHIAGKSFESKRKIAIVLVEKIRNMLDNVKSLS